MLMTELPKQLQQDFEQLANLVHGQDSLKKALIEAIELWLQYYKHLTKPEAKANDEFFDKAKTELEKDYFGKWVVIAYGQLQGAGETLEEVSQLALDAKDRIVVQIGQTRPKQVEVGWQIAFN